MRRLHPSTPARRRTALLACAFVTMVVFMALAKEPEPYKVVVTPKMGLSPLLVTVSVYVFQGDPAWTCPGVTIVWPNKTESKNQSDCDPEDPVFDTFTRTMYFGPGSNEIEVHLEQGKQHRVERRTVEVW